jgi:hypothetical protein
MVAEGILDADGDFIVRFSPHEVHGYEVTMLFLSQGVNGEVYGLRSLSNIRLSEEFIPAAMAACNNWAMRNMAPTAFVVGEQTEEEDGTPGEIQGAIILHSYYPLAAGVTQAILDELTTNFIGAAFAFWEWFATEGITGMRQMIGDTNDDGTVDEGDALGNGGRPAAPPAG